MLPQGLVSAVHRNLASLYLEQGRYTEGLEMFDRWLALPFITPSAQDHLQRAQILYLLEQYSAAITDTRQAIASSDSPRETSYELLYALQWITGDEAGAADTREFMTAQWPESAPSEVVDPQAFAETLRGTGMGRRDSEYLPIVKPAPVYPPRALASGIEGFVVVRYTVTTTGETGNLEVIESTSEIFDRAALAAVAKFKYVPRTIEGTPIEVAGVTSRVDFVLADND
jgi:TonB family protein